MSRHIGILGGTFDPVHKGHIQMAELALSHHSIDEVWMLPNKIPVHKAAAVANQHHRLGMLELAIGMRRHIDICTEELDRSTPSYMIDTLISLNKKQPNTHWSLIIGMDSFQHLHRWHRHQEILHYCNVIVFQRPGNNKINTSEVSDSYQGIRLENQRNNGDHSIIIDTQANIVATSSSRIREHLQDENWRDDGIIDPNVLAYIREQQLY